MSQIEIVNIKFLDNQNNTITQSDYGCLKSDDVKFWGEFNKKSNSNKYIFFIELNSIEFNKLNKFVKPYLNSNTISLQSLNQSPKPINLEFDTKYNSEFYNVRIEHIIPELSHNENMLEITYDNYYSTNYIKEKI